MPGLLRSPGLFLSFYLRHRSPLFDFTTTRRSFDSSMSLFRSSFASPTLSALRRLFHLRSPDRLPPSSSGVYRLSQDLRPHPRVIESFNSLYRGRTALSVVLGRSGGVISCTFRFVLVIWFEHLVLQRPFVLSSDLMVFHLFFVSRFALSCASCRLSFGVRFAFVRFVFFPFLVPSVAQVSARRVPRSMAPGIKRSTVTCRRGSSHSFFHSGFAPSA